MHNRWLNRRGLSTLELTLALPILLFVMALMVNFGVAACWKVRASAMARQVLWDNRSEHSGSNDPQPAYWPASGTTADSGSDVPSLDDPRLDQPVVRGPLVGALVNGALLDPTSGLHTASANLTRLYALLNRTGSYNVGSQCDLLDNHWTWSQMGLSGNDDWRIPAIYTLMEASPSYVQVYVDAAMAIYGASFLPALQPLDNDDEFIEYGSIFGWPAPPDFYPKLNQFCSLDPQLANFWVTDLINRIQGNPAAGTQQLAETMAQAFITLYEQVIWAIQHPPTKLPPGQLVPLQGQIQQLQAKIDQLEEFLMSIGGGGGP